MDQQSIQALAKQGNPVAIAHLLNQIFSGNGIQARTKFRDSCLHILLEAAQVPNAQVCSRLICDRLTQLAVPSIQSVRIYARQIGQQLPAWNQGFLLASAVQVQSLQVPPCHPQSPRAILPPESSQPTTKIAHISLPLVALASMSFVLGIGWSFLLQSQPNQPTQLAQPGIFAGNRLASTALSGSQPSSTANLTLQPSTTPTSAQSQATPSAALTPLPSSAVESPITIKAVGDIILGTNFPSDRLPEQQGKTIFRNIRPYLQGADILFGNFESTFTNYPHSAKNVHSSEMTFAFRTPPSYAMRLREAGFHVLSVANNHSMDFFEIGFEDTLRAIQKAGMRAVGKKGQILYFTVRDKRFAFIGFSYLDYHNSIHDLTNAKNLVRTARKNADIVVISFHAGAEGSDEVRTRNVAESFYGENRGNSVLFSRTVVDEGADLVLGHGPHVPRALELYKGKLIAYSLGNFVGYRTLSTQGTLGYSLILQAQMDEEGNFIEGKIIPVHLNGNGIPKLDNYFRSVVLMRQLTQLDFPKTPLTIDRSGKILKVSGQKSK